ncbi:MAG: hypothetical protein GWN00_01175 [Aliifodinibius sp.]|nr:hypothetical protein [Fodinibius sp.]NIV09943.1 hypothetical protein [Fodinibius sp.]NIY23473.1 hypothetical protein [Fodinibius sp.]
MNITIYTDKEPTGSIYLMSQDLAEILRGRGYEVIVTSKLSQKDLGTPDLLLNFIPTHIHKILNLKRYIHIGRIVTVYTPSLDAVSESDLIHILSSAAQGVPIVAISRMVRDHLTLVVNRVYSPAYRRKILGNLHYIPYGVRDIFTFGEKHKRAIIQHTFVAPFIRCVEGQKQYSKHRELSQKLSVGFSRRSIEMTTRLYVCAEHMSHVSDVNTDGYEVRNTIIDRKKYAEELQEVGAAVSLSKTESFGLYYVELLLAGVVVYFAKYPWVDQLLPGYKLQAPIKDIPEFVLECQKNYPKCRKYILYEVIPYIRRYYLLEEGFSRSIIDTFGES